MHVSLGFLTADIAPLVADLAPAGFLSLDFDVFLSVDFDVFVGPLVGAFAAAEAGFDFGADVEEVGALAAEAEAGFAFAADVDFLGPSFSCDFDPFLLGAAVAF